MVCKDAFYSNSDINTNSSGCCILSILLLWLNLQISMNVQKIPAFVSSLAPTQMVLTFAVAQLVTCCDLIRGDAQVWYCSQEGCPSSAKPRSRGPVSQKVPLVNGPEKLFIFTLMIEVSIVLPII